MILDDEIIEKYSKSDSRNGANLKTLKMFSVLGFFENLDDYDKVIKILIEEDITYDAEKSKYLIWLDDISDTLKKQFKTKLDEKKRGKGRN